MADTGKTRNQLINELAGLRQRVDELEKRENDRRRTEETLMKSAERYKELVDSLPQMLIEFDEKGNITFANHNAFEVFGYTHKDLAKGLNVLHMIVPEDRKRAAESIEKTLRGERSGGNEYVAVRNDGSTIPVEAYNSVITSENIPVGLRAIIVDITTRKRAEQRIVQIAAIVESSNDAIVSKTLDGIITNWNKGAEKIYGYSESEVMGKPISMLVPPGRDDEVPEILEKIKLGEHIEHYETVRRRKDGQYIHMSLTISPIRDAEGRIIGVSTVGRDITERRQTEERLMESEERYRTAIEHSNDGVALVRGGLHIYVNQKFLEIFGYDSPEEAIGKTHSLTVHPDDLEMVAERTRKRERGEPVPSRYEFKGIRKDGTPIYIEVSAAVIAFHGEPVTLAYFRDVTERKRLEEKLHTISLTDELTGLYNRRGFIALCKQQLKLAERTKRAMVLFFADLDDMKRINDTWGHQEGDIALVRTAAVLKETFRESDIIARIGGDEFAVLAIDASKAIGEALTARLQNCLDANNTHYGMYRLSFSIGTAHYDPENPSSLDELLGRADTLMYEAKSRKQH